MSEAVDSNAGSIETKADVGQGNPALARFWTIQLDLSDEDEKPWRTRARKVLDIYADNARAKAKDESRRSVKFNILYSNVQTLAPALLPSIPKADVRRRFRDEDVIGKTAADMLERCAQTMCDQFDFEHICKQAVRDRCLPGRAIIREDYELSTDDDEEGKPKEITLQTSRSRQVMWDDFRRGPGRNWDEVTWIAFRHKLTRDQAVAALGRKMGEAFPLNLTEEGAKQHPDGKDDNSSQFKRGEAWEIWDKDTRKVVWISKDYKDGPLKVQDDPLDLDDFFPTPRPLYAIAMPDSLTPIEEFRMYEDQARELDKVTRRIDKIVSGLKVRGIAASTITEFALLANADDNEMIQTKSGDALAALQQGGLDKAVWMWPLDQAIKALQELYVQREGIKQTIYEIVGISDILRGAVDPKEKLGQSQLKASAGARRMDDAREEVQRYLRDVIRLKIEIIAEHFEPQQIMMMSGIKLPSMAEKQQAQMMLQAQAAPQPMNGGSQAPSPPPPPQGQAVGAAPPPQIPPQIEEMLKLPTIEEVMQVIRSDAMRLFRVDIETDQTVVGDENQEKQQMTDFLSGTAQYWTAMGPVIQGGFPAKVAIGLYQAASRRFHLGRDMDEELDKLVDEPPPIAKAPPDPKMLQAQTDAQNAQLDAKRKDAETQANLALQAKKQEGEAALAQQKLNAEIALEQKKHEDTMALEQQRVSMDHERAKENDKAKLEDGAQARRDQFEAAGTPVGQAGVMQNVAEQFSQAVAAMTQALQTLAQGQQQMAEAMMADNVAMHDQHGRIIGARKVPRQPQGMVN